MERYSKDGGRIVQGVLDQFYGLNTFAERKKFVTINFSQAYTSPRNVKLLCDRWYTILVRSLWGDIDMESFKSLDEYLTDIGYGKRVKGAINVCPAFMESWTRSMIKVSNTFNKSHSYFVPEILKPECWPDTILEELCCVGRHAISQSPRYLLRTYFRCLENPSLRSENIDGLLDRYRKEKNFDKWFTKLKVKLIRLLECLLCSLAFHDNTKEKLESGIRMLKENSRSFRDQGSDLIDNIQQKATYMQEEDASIPIASRPKSNVIAREVNEDSTPKPEAPKTEQTYQSGDEVKDHETAQGSSFCGLEGPRKSPPRAVSADPHDDEHSWTDDIQDIASYLSTHYPNFKAKDISEKTNTEKLQGQRYLEETIEFRDLLSDFDEELKDSIKDILVFDIIAMPKFSRSLWSASGVQLPQLSASGYPSGRCWKSECPSERTLHFATQKLLSTQASSQSQRCTVYRRGETDSTTEAEIAITQMSYDDVSNPVWLTGLYLPCLSEASFRPSEAVDRKMESFNVANQQLLMTPKFSFTNLHIDECDGLSSPIGGCVKIWLMFPPTAWNLSLLHYAEGTKPKLELIGKYLEGGIVCKTTSQEALYIPMGCIHAVFTARKGFLVTIDFLTSVSASAYGSLISEKYHEWSTSASVAGYFDSFLASVEIGLDNNKKPQAIGSWLKCKEQIVRYARRNPEWREKAEEVWDEFFEQLHSEHTVCTCGSMDAGTSFKKHWSAMHSFLKSESPIKATKRKRPVIEDSEDEY